MFKKVLIANRGEIAVRVIRALRDLGVRSVAIYTKEDTKSLHVQLADQRICIGEGAAKDNYLNIERVIQAARNMACDAIHPGYGLLAENPDFARACEENDITFIGPSAEIIEKMGDKSEARKLMKAAGVPIVPGTIEPVTDADSALKEAKSIGFPVMIKAAAGGGGKGMRAVMSEADFVPMFNLAQLESAGAFGDDRMYLEKLIISPKHVEVQVMADSHGNIVTLGERDCSVQRNHQKLIEEAPSPAVDDATRQKMYDAAYLAAKTANYVNAGTVEFIVDADGSFYFMEMNTRIQVEHGVTEVVTGTDLVIEQIKVAAGEELSFAQEDISVRGHAIECRINAEIPEKNFMPSPGTVTTLHLPSGNGVRVDTALYTGCYIPPEYDSMVAKIIVHAKDRDSAIKKMRTALDETLIVGVNTNLDMQYLIMQNQNFAEGKADTGFVEEFLSGGRTHEAEM